MATQGSQKQPEAMCPHCGSPMGKSPMGQQILKQVAAKMRPRPQGIQAPQRQPENPQSAMMQRMRGR